MQRLDPDRIRGLSGVRLPHNVARNMLKEKSYHAPRTNNFMNRAANSPRSSVAHETTHDAKNDSEQKVSREEMKAAGGSEVKTDSVSDVSGLKNGFYDNISFESQGRKQFN